jgi:WD40 repeat protein/energy-coupling factor transporter ATP-binding protein EcfA2
MGNYALVIGIAQYEHFHNLPKAAVDAEAIATIFTQHDYIVECLPKRFVDQRPTIAIGRSLTSDELKTGLKTFFKDRAKQQNAVIYFAGHGFRVFDSLNDNYTGYLAASDSTKEGSNAISFDALSQAMRDAELSSLVVLLDCCYAGSLADQKPSLHVIQDTLSSKHHSCLIAACRDFERAREGEKHGIFTEAVLKGLVRSYDGHREITSADLLGFVTRELRTVGQEVTCAGINLVIPLISHPLDKVRNFETDETIIPYRGLEPFEKEQAKFFFGREQVVEDIWRLLDQHNFVAVIGASGSGKSSVVRAGLIPWVEENGWQVLEPPLNPGMTPLAKLITVFESYFEGVRQRTQLHDFVYQASEGLSALAENLPGSDRYLLVIDQFEEVFTQPSREEQTRFINLLTEAANMPHPRIAVIITIRADFFDECLLHSALNSLIQKQAIFMPPLKGADLEKAIIKPAQLQGYSLESGLLGEILKDAGQEQGILPLLQFTLWELWKERNQETHQLEIAKYRQIGGITGALNKQAESFYCHLTDQEKAWLQQICLQLVRTGKREKDTRQRQPLRQILGIGQNSSEREALNELVEKFTCRRLFIRGFEDTEEWVDLAHEALFERWETFANWCKKDREWRRIKDVIYERYRDWQEHDDDPFFLIPKGIIIQAEAEPQNLDLFLQNADFKRYFRESHEYHKKADLATAQRLFYGAKQAQEALRSGTPVSGFMQTLQIVDESLKLQPLTQDLPGIIQDTLRQSLEISREQNCFYNRDGMVKCVAISPDSQFIVSGGTDQTLKLWDLQGNCRQVFQGLGSTVWAVTFTPDGKAIVSGSEDGALRLWDLEGRLLHQPFLGHTDCIRSIAISPDGRLIASASKDKTVRLWYLDGTPHEQPFVGHEDWVLSVAFSPKSDFILSGSADCTIRQWSLNGKLQGLPFRGHTHWVRSVSVSPSGKFIVSGSGDNTIRLWNLDGSPKGEPFEGHKDRVLSVAIAPRDQFIVSGSADCTIRLWDLEGHPIGETLEGHQDWIRSVRVSPDGKFIASASRDRTVRLWDLQGNLMSQVLLPPSGRVLSVAFSPNGRFIASGGEDKMVHLWDLQNKTIVQSFEGHTSWIRSLRFTSDGNYIVSGSADNTLRLWSLQGEPVRELSDGHDAWVRSVAVSPDGQFIISSSDDKTVCLWSLSDRNYCFSKCFGRHDDRVLSVAISPDSACKLVVSGSADKTIRLWNLDDESDPVIFKGHQSRVLSVAFSPMEGKYIVSGSQDKTVRLWNLQGNQIWTQQHEDKVRAVVFSPDGSFIASGSEDCTICLWDLQGNPIGQPLRGHRATVRSIKFSPDGKYIVSGSEDGTIRLWDVGTWKDWLEICRDRVRYHPSFAGYESNDIEINLAN